MWLLLTFIILSVHHISGAVKKPRDVMLEALKDRYKFEPLKASSEAGEPLILTEYIENNQTDQARKAAYVEPTLMLGKESYSGYLTVESQYNSNMWFWYFPVSGKPVEDTPLILWLQGGPGVSSLFGLFTEIGPFQVKDGELKEIEYSWLNCHSLLFFDNPIGTGFSFTHDEQGYSTNQTKIGENLYKALQQFFEIFPELRAVPLTIAGESYAGKHIPSLGIQILWNKNKDKPINLQGLAIGNGFIDPPTINKYSDFLREVGLLDDETANEMKEFEADLVESFDDDNMMLAQYYHSLVLDLYMEASGLEFRNLYNYLDDSYHDPIDFPAFGRFVQRDDVRRALHVGDTAFGDLYKVYSMLRYDFMRSARPWLEELLENYRVMLYNGHLDVIVAYHPSVNTYEALNFTGAHEYKTADRKVWYHDKIVAGYYKTGGNLLEVMVRGAGHMVPSDKPAAALGLISAFSRGISLDEDTAERRCV